MKECPYKKGDKLVFSPSERTISSYQDITLFGLIPGCIYVLDSVKENMYLHFEEGGGFPYGEFRKPRLSEIKLGNDSLQKKYFDEVERLKEKKKNFESINKINGGQSH